MKTDTFRLNRSDVVDEVIEGEAILINLKTGSYYSLEGSACTLWERIRLGPVDSAALRDFARAAFIDCDPRMLEATDAFLVELVAEGLLEASDEPATGIDDSVSGGANPGLPVLSKYSDMEALLLIDPIHDVTPQGWPQRRAEDS